MQYFQIYFAPLELIFHIMRFIYKYLVILLLNPKLQSSMIFLARMLHIEPLNQRVAELFCKNLIGQQ